MLMMVLFFFFFFQAEDGIRDLYVTGVQTCALPILTREETVALAARKGQRLFENRSSPVKIALVVYGDSEIAEAHRQAMIVAERPPDPGALHQQRLRSCVLVARHEYHCEVGLLVRRPSHIAKCPVERVAFPKQSLSLVIVALTYGDIAEGAQRTCSVVRGTIVWDRIEQSVEPLAGFGEGSPPDPPKGEVGCDSKRVGHLFVDRPLQRGPNVVELSRHPIDPETLLGPDQRLERFLGKRQDPREVPTSPLRFLVGFTQSIERVLAYRLQHPITSRSLVFFGEDEILVRQGCEQADGVRFLDSVARADVFRSRQCPPTGEDRRSTQHGLLTFGQQFVAPIDRRP